MRISVRDLNFPAAVLGAHHGFLHSCEAYNLNSFARFISRGGIQ